MEAVTLLPCSRPVDMRVIDSLAASDVPRHVLCVIDSSQAWDWPRALRGAGFDVDVHPGPHASAVPPTDPVERRPAHLEMRRFTQTILPDSGLVLAIEDDGIMPPDAFSLLLAALDGRKASTLVQASRHGSLRAWGVWRNGDTFRTLETREADTCDACGHFALLTSCKAYRDATIICSEGWAGAVDRAHTRHFAPIGVDWSVVGHIGDTIITEAIHVIEYEQDGRRLPLRFIERSDMRAEPGEHTYETKEPVVVNGIVVVPRRRRIPMSQAAYYASIGAINDLALSIAIEPPPDPRAALGLETKTLTELRAIAESRGIDIPAKANRKTIIARLEA